MIDLNGLLIAVDFDGTIAHYDGWMGVGKFGKPIENVKWALEKFREQGAKIIIHTCRAEIHLVKEYLKEHSIPFDYVNFSPREINYKTSDKKVNADIYIDDKAIPFCGEWKETYMQVVNFKTWRHKHSSAISSKE